MRNTAEGGHGDPAKQNLVALREKRVIGALSFCLTKKGGGVRPQGFTLELTVKLPTRFKYMCLGFYTTSLHYVL